MNAIIIPSKLVPEIAAFRDVLKQELPGFWWAVRPQRFLNQDYVIIRIAARDYLINGVDAQRPQAVALTCTDGVLDSHHSHIFRDPNPELPGEKYLVMAAVPVPFRKNKPGKQVEALRRFCIAYKQVLREHRGVLRYREIVDYDKLLNQ